MPGHGLMLGEAEGNGETGMVRLLTCLVCGRLTFAGAGRRQDTVYCSGQCRSRAWRNRAAHPCGSSSARLTHGQYASGHLSF